MREIKFRAWDKESSEMFYTENNLVNEMYFWFDNGKLELLLPVEDDFPEKRDCDIMQSSGLKDKNGVEIYEGDIVSGVAFQDGKPTQPTHGLPVTFENGCFMWSNEFIGWDLDDEESRVFTPCDTNTWAVVVGNIYEHPELVKIKK